MPVLNTADAVYLGSQAVSAIMLGEQQVWPALDVPANTVAPSITGSPTIGVLLSVNVGSWTGFPTSYAYRWEHDDGGWTEVGTGSTYTPVDEGPHRVRVIATNDVGDSDPVYSNTVEVAAAPEGMVWIGGGRAIITGGDATADPGFAGDQYQRAMVWSDVLPDNSYAEISLRYNPGASFYTAAAGVWVEASPADLGEWSTDVGQFFEEESLGAYVDGSATIFTLHNGDDYKAPGSVNSSLAPLVRFGVVRRGTSVWIRQVWSGGAGDWIGGGDPETLTAPTGTMASSTGLRLCVTFPAGGEAHVYPPANHYGLAPSGCTAV